MFDESDSPPGSTEAVDTAEPVPAEAPAADPAPAEPVASEPSPAEPPVEPSPAEARFKKCRFHAEQDGTEYCSNRDVLPYAGKSGFSAEAWCPDCTLYKLRRTPKKRPKQDDFEDNYPY